MAPAYYASVGGAVVKTGTGSSNALQLFGIPEGPVRIEITEFELPVKSDVGGPEGMVDVQDMGAQAIIRMTLSAWDSTILTTLAKKSGESGEGTLPAMGYFMAGAGYTWRLLIDSSTDTPWNFPTAKIRTRQLVPSSQYNKLDLTWLAFGYISPSSTSATGKVLYNRTNT